MPKTEHEFTSFAAPSPEDIAAFDALSEEEQKADIEEELAKGFRGETVEPPPISRRGSWLRRLCD